MDFQVLVDSCGMAAAVLSVEELSDGHWGDVRIVKANSKYKQIMGPKYYDDMVYSELLPKEPNFEDFCFRCAVKKTHLHAYVDTKSMGLWTDGTYIPLDSSVDNGNIHYMLFFFEFTKGPESDRMSDVSLDVAPFVIQTCINLRGSENFYASMKTVIADIQEKTEAFCSSIIMIDKQKNKYAPLCAKFRNDEATMDDFMPFLTPDVVFSWEETLKLRDNIIVKDEYDMKELEKINPLWVKSLRGAKVESLVLAPLTHGKKLFGVLFITNFNIENLVEIKQFIELTAFFLSSEIANNDMMEKLEYMSNVDTLTGVKNRNSMNARVDWHFSKEMCIPAPIGIVFADLNGLKRCNDTGGHEAGDRLLKNAAEVLKKHFGKYEIYRTGGDEFVVIVPNADKDSFEKNVEILRADSGDDSSVSLAIGSSWSENPDELRLSMHIADEAMYQDKNEYYKRHPEEARK